MDDAYCQKSAAELVVLCRNGDKQAWATLLNRYYNYLRSRAVLKLGEFGNEYKAQAEDCVQTALLKAFTHLHQYEEQNKIRGWLVTLVMHECIDYVRRNHRTKQLSQSSDLSSIPKRSSEPDAITRQDTIGAAISKLPDEEREYAILHFYERLSPKQISKTLEIPPSTVYLRGARTRRKLREILRELGCDPSAD